MNTPIYKGLAQSDLDMAGFNLLNFSGGSSGGTGLLPGMINVKDPPYNAVGDGVTDDTAAIQAALNHIGTLGNGGTLYFPIGVYMCNGSWDATTNSILKIPYNAYPANTRPIALQGEINSWAGAIIRTTRTDGAGSYPALLAANTSQGTPADELTAGYFNISYVIIKNMMFLVPTNPTMSGVRLDTTATANVEDVLIFTEAVSTTEPGHDTVGLWMPNGGNFGVSNANNVQVIGFQNGLFVSEHFIGRNMFLYGCKVGLGTLTGYQTAQINFNSYWNQIHIQNRGNHLPVDLVARMEDTDPGGGAPSWQLVVRHVDDPGNTIWGTMNYIRVREPEREHSDIILNGAANLRMFNMFTQTANFLRIGDDLRLVPITGGGKLQARNPGTNTWADVDQWTNP
jgi:Pectate lyase superfamily protein